MTLFLRVRPVEGRMVANPFARGRMVGYEASANPKNLEYRMESGRMEPSRDWNRVDGDVLLQETTDGYIRRAILDGDLEYIETVENPGTKSERKTRSPELVLASTKHAKVREAQKLAETKYLAEQASLEARALAAADQGLTLDELNAKEAEEAKKKTDKSAETTEADVAKAADKDGDQ